jgi:hypothetical protein
LCTRNEGKKEKEGLEGDKEKKHSPYAQETKILAYTNDGHVAALKPQTESERTGFGINSETCIAVKPFR